MKKIGIITMYDRMNFGNRLQNYAVQTVLTRLGYECETLVPEKQLRRNAKSLGKHILKNVICYFRADTLCYKYPDMVRHYRIDCFNRNIKFRAVKGENNQFLPSLADEYDYFTVGSDQTWNPHFWNTSIGSEEVGLNNYLLKFARPEQRKCCSPSLGIPELPEEWQEPFREELMKFDQISVREAAGAAHLSELTGKHVQVTLDPTLLLDKEEWIKVSRPTKNCPNKKYILYVMLGSEAKGIPDEAKKKIATLARNQKFETCRMIIRKRPEFFSCGAGEFIHMIRNAELVCTDSFHCTVFSIIFGKPFLLFPRIMKKYSGMDMSSRTNTLLELLHLERKKTENQDWSEAGMLECDYSDSWKALDAARKKSIEILNQQFKSAGIEDCKESELCNR